PERREILMSMVADMAEMDYYKDAEAEQVNALIETALNLPEDTSMGSFFASIRREQAKAEGLDFDGLTDHDVLVGELWNVFPNITTPCNAGNAGILRFRPNGADPESSILDVFYLQLFADPASAPPLEQEFYADWRECDRWGTVVMQDFTNL